MLSPESNRRSNRGQQQEQRRAPPSGGHRGGRPDIPHEPQRREAQAAEHPHKRSPQREGAQIFPHLAGVGVHHQPETVVVNTAAIYGRIHNLPKRNPCQRNLHGRHKRTSHSVAGPQRLQGQPQRRQQRAEVEAESEIHFIVDFSGMCAAREKVDYRVCEAPQRREGHNRPQRDVRTLHTGHGKRRHRQHRGNGEARGLLMARRGGKPLRQAEIQKIHRGPHGHDNQDIR